MDTNKSSDPERRSSVRQSLRVSVTAADEEEFALAAMGISDGFGPSSSSENVASRSATPPNDSAQLAPPQPIGDSPQRPSSIAKTRYNDSFSLRHDGTGNGNVGNDARLRESMASNDNPFLGAAGNDSPYTGPTGPSFPYQMYPQNVRSNRTASMATTSTSAPLAERSYTGPHAPTHPYGMYPQNTAGDLDGMAAGAPTQPIPVGFPGTADQYRRRVPDATDLIGPDGHTEELPPYTRYPNEAYAPKPNDQQPQRGVGMIAGGMVDSVQSNATSSGAMSIPSRATSAQQQHQQQQLPQSLQPTSMVPSTIPGAGGLGLATRNPEFSSSRDDLGSPGSRYSAQSFGSQASSHEINTAATAVASNEKPKSGWKKKADKRLWGVIPYWAICLVFVSLILMGIILGAVVGTFLARREKGPKKDREEASAVPATVTVTLDAMPLSTVPADLRELEEGDFSLPIVSAQRSSKTCFNNTLQSNAWSCNIVFSELMMSVAKLNGNPPTSQYAVNLACNTSFTINSNYFSYGTQPPCFNQNHTMDLVTDIYEPNRGPAWFFQMPYDKTVILPESYLSVDDDADDDDDLERKLKQKRFNPEEGQSFKRKGVANPGEKPWICTWGGTLLEVFVYANQDSNGYRGYTSMSALGASYLATATDNPFKNSPASPSPTPAADFGDEDFDDGADDDGMVTSGSIDEETTTVTATTTITNPVGSETEIPNASTTYGQWDLNGPKLPPAPYPRVVKIEERRMNGPPATVPFCQQWEILDSGRRPVVDEQGREVLIEIGESEPDPTVVDVDDILPQATDSAESEASKARRRALRLTPHEFEDLTGGAYYVDHSGILQERNEEEQILVGQDLSDCGCLWWTL